MDPSLIYLVCFLVGLLFAMASAILAGFSGGHGDGSGHLHLPHHDGHGHGGHGDSGGGHLQSIPILSPTIVGTFSTAFGGIGLLISHYTTVSTVWISVPLALIGGFLVSAIVLLAFRKVFQATQGSSEGRISELIGHAATVITPIFPGGVGEIAYVQGGTRYTAPARADGEKLIASGSTVWIVRISGTQFFVMPS